MPIWSPAFFGSAGATGYVIEDSVWFDGSDDYLTFDPGSASSTPDLYCISFWAKRSALGGTNVNVIAGGSSGLEDILRYKTDQLEFTINGGGGGEIQTNAVYRDPTAWQHVFVKYDSANGTAGDRMRMFVNGAEITSFATDSNPSSGLDSNLLDGAIIAVGAYPDGSQNFNGYLAEFIVLDGQDKAVTDFGEYDSNTGIWIPKEFSGSYGSNGFKLNFSNASSLGADTSGNGNNFTVNGSMATTQQVTDTCTNDADNNIGNYATLNPIATGSGGTFSGGNLTVTPANLDGEIATIGLSSGKWYWECTQNANGGEVGVYTASALLTTSGGGQANGVGSFDLNFNGRTHNNPIGGTLSTSSDYTQWAFASGDVIGVALDMDAGKIWFRKNGTYLQSGSGTSGNVGDPAAGSNEMMSGITTTVFPMVGDGTGTAANAQTINFGQSSFAHSAPSGFNNINTANFAEPTVTDPSAFYQNKIYTGNGSTNALTFDGNSDMQPDFVWIKDRSETDSHALFDSVRGVQKYLQPNATSDEQTSSDGITSFNSDGFTIGGDLNPINSSGDSFVAWCMKAGGAPSADNTGDRTPTNNSVMKNDAAVTTSNFFAAADIYPTRMSIASHGGFAIGTYAGNSSGGSSAQTIAHGFGAVPDVILQKQTDASGQDWNMYHISNHAGSNDPQDFDLSLNSSAAQDDNATKWNDTAPTSTLFTVGTSGGVNGSGKTFVFYLFKRTPGLIGIGYFTGNNSANGPNVVVDDGTGFGFKPAWVIFKKVDASSNWFIRDSARNPFNPVNLELYSNSTDADYSDGNSEVDFTSNGFKIRGAAGGYNSSGNKIIYVAFAESPFVLNNRAR
jgi:hypothetical protein